MAARSEDSPTEKEVHVYEELKWRYPYSASEIQLDNLINFFLMYYSISAVLFLV